MSAQWISHLDKYPYVSRETLSTRGWLLVRKVNRAAGVTVNDRILARMLIERSRQRYLDLLIRQLELIADGRVPAHAKREGGDATP